MITAARGRLLVVRHGRTAGNVGGRRMGRQDLPLDAVGRQQAAALAPALAGLLAGDPVAEVVSSPLARARQTIDPFAARAGTPVRLDPDLLEMDYGTAQDGVAPGVRLRVKSRHLYEPLPGGESLHDVWRRCGGVLERLRRRLDAGGTVVVVSHYRVVQLLTGRCLGLGFEETVARGGLRPANGSVHLVVPGAGGSKGGLQPVWAPEAA